MRYLILIYVDPATYASVSEAEQQAEMAEYCPRPHFFASEAGTFRARRSSLLIRRRPCGSATASFWSPMALSPRRKSTSADSTWSIAPIWTRLWSSRAAFPTCGAAQSKCGRVGIFLVGLWGGPGVDPFRRQRAHPQVRPT